MKMRVGDSEMGWLCEYCRLSELPILLAMCILAGGCLRPCTTRKAWTAPYRACGSRITLSHRALSHIHLGFLCLAFPESLRVLVVIS